VTLLSLPEWQALAHAHRERADVLTAGHRERAARGERHPVEDFLYTYYAYKPSILRRWHPGAGVALAEASSTDRASWRWYHATATPGALAVDDTAFRDEKRELVAAIERLLRATAGRPASFGCFGLHEWAMVYRQGEHRHPVPLRLGPQGTDAVVEAHDLRCTHFDAYRFFTDDAVPRNRTALTRELQPAVEQPGCLHANMDVYKWAVKLGPLTPGDLLLDAFELARDIRYLDMQASPYDMREWAGEPVRIETPDGKAEYVRRQRGFAERAHALRTRLLAALDVDTRALRPA
jgi:hypothetical protein